jgi:hypothetical protein
MWWHWRKKNSTILRSAHTVCLCALYGSQNKQRLFPYTAFLTGFITETGCVCCAVRTGPLNVIHFFKFLKVGILTVMACLRVHLPQCGLSVRRDRNVCHPSTVRNVCLYCCWFWLWNSLLLQAPDVIYCRLTSFVLWQKFVVKPM